MSILDEIIEVKKEEVKILKRDFTTARFRDSKFFEEEALSFRNALKKDDTISIIAEIKKASPSKGVIRDDFNHLKIAKIYFDEEIDAVSVLTDKNFFKGSIDYLNEIACIKCVPLLRKDFIIDEYQIYEAKSNGADAILLICEILSVNQIKELTLCSSEMGMEVLLETHSPEELEKIDFSLNTIIGINNRDLHTFKTNTALTGFISSLLPSGIITVSESGIRTKQDFDLLKKHSINASLIGEYLMESPDIKERISEIKEWSRYES